MKFELRARWESYKDPAVVLRFAVYYYIQVLFEFLLQGKFDLDAIRTEAFARFWLFLSPPATPPTPSSSPSSTIPSSSPSSPTQPALSTSDDPTSDPTDRDTYLPRLLHLATGTVLDIGPGSGSMFQYLDTSATSEVGTIYGCEPVASLHPALKASADAVGLGGKLVVLGCGAQEGALVPELHKRGLLGQGKRGGGEGVFDTIVAVRSLCGVPDLEDTLRMLYGLLKPGGKFLVWEHTVVKPFLEGAERREAERRKTTGTPAAALMQHIYTYLGWPYFVGGCQLRKDTIGLLERLADRDGGWESVEVRGEGNRYAVLPFVTGIFVKRG